ncbi:MAG: hypothetical protein ACYDD5_00700 [Sulfuricurvum sp.]
MADNKFLSPSAQKYYDKWNTPGQAPVSQAPQGLAANIANLSDRASGRNYINFDGNMTGGLGNYATYNGIGINEDAYKSIVKPEGATSDMNVDGLSVNGAGGGTSFMGGLGAISSGIGAASALMNSLNARKQLKQADEKFGAEKAIANANYINSARLSNADDARKTGVGLVLGGNAISDAQRASTMSGLEARKLSENAIV